MFALTMDCRGDDFGSFLEAWGLCPLLEGVDAVARVSVLGEDVLEPVLKDLPHTSFIAHVDMTLRVAVPQRNVEAPIRRLHVSPPTRE